MAFHVSAATPPDYDSITQLLDAAFAPSRYESRLVARLRAEGRLTDEWVIRDDHGVAGHVAYSPAYHGDTVIGHHLAPVAVRPDVQRRGVGTRLITASLAEIRAQHLPVFVLGDPRYYRRFGFVPIAQPTCPFDPSNEHFMALGWTEGPAFVVGYAAAFHES